MSSAVSANLKGWYTIWHVCLTPYFFMKKKPANQAGFRKSERAAHAERHAQS
jgi:hypothetical protein